MIQKIRDFLMKVDIILANIQKVFDGKIIIKTASCGNIVVSKEIIQKVNRTESRKIPRIKLIRNLTCCGLKESKEIVEEIWNSGLINDNERPGAGSIKKKYL